MMRVFRFACVLLLVTVFAGAALGVGTGKGFEAPYSPASVKAVVPAYSVQADLSNVVNKAQFGTFDAQQKALLVKNAFFAAPADNQQLFHVYEENDYKLIPSFVTTDSVLQVYHIFYDFTLRKLETGKLYDVLDQLTTSMEKESGSVQGKMTSPEWKKAAASNRAYFLVGCKLLGKQNPLTGTIGAQVKGEVALIEAHAGRSESEIFPYEADFSQFVPRGHYTRSAKLKRFFKTMMYYGYMPFPVLLPGGEKTPLRQSVLVTNMLFHTQINGKPAIQAWERIYEPTVFYVGASDDLTPYDYKKAMDVVYGPNPTYAQLQDEGKLRQFTAELMKLPAPQIVVQNMPGGPQFKLMGQRYIPDSEMLQHLVEWPVRLFPKGLDVMAVLGSKRAAYILDDVYHEGKNWSGYLPERTKLTKRFTSTPLDTWQSNLYWGWMWQLESELHTYGSGYPTFMTNQAWVDKGLNTSLGSWAELRHDTILYAKQSATAECGGDEGQGKEPPVPKGYVEPNVEFYNRLLWLTKTSRMGLDSRQLLTNELRSKFMDFEGMITFLKTVSTKELTNQKLTAAEYDEIRLFGANLDTMTLSVIDDQAKDWSSIEPEADRDMASIADVHTSQESCLEEGVGHASEIFVIVPIEGKLRLTRGAIFSYYEFIHPSNDRLTDEKWQDILKTGKAPAPPVWTSSFLSKKRHTIPEPKNVRSYSSGC